MVTPTFLPYLGGQEVYVQELSENLVQRGHEVTIFTTDAVSRIPFKRAITKQQEGDAFTVIRFPCYGFLYSYIPIAPRLIFSILSKKISHYHIVHVHGFGHFTSDIVALMRRTFKVPVVLTTHGLHQETGQQGILRSLLWSYYRDTCVRFTLNTVDRVLVLSPDEIRYLARFGSDVQEKVKVVPIGVATEEFSHPKPRTHIGRPMVLYVGRIYPGKGLEFLIEAISRLKQYNPLAMFVGEKTEFAKALQEQATNMGVAKNVILTGFVDEKEKMRLISEATVFCLPSKYEGASLAVLEAMAAGKPIVATKTGGLQYLVDDRSSGFLVRYGNVDEIAACLEKTITDPGLRNEMGKKGRAIAERHAWSNVTRMIEGTYLEILRNLPSQRSD